MKPWKGFIPRIGHQRFLTTFLLRGAFSASGTFSTSCTGRVRGPSHRGRSADGRRGSRPAWCGRRPLDGGHGVVETAVERAETDAVSF